MGVAGTDLLIVERDGTLYKATAADVAALGGGGGSWTQISSATPTGVSAVEFNDIPGTYADLLITFDGVSHNAGTSQAVNVEFSADGTSWTSSANMTTAGAAADTQRGVFFVPHYTNGLTSWMGLTQNIASGAQGANAQCRSAPVALSSAITDIRLSLASGNFDAGTIRLLGR